MKKIILFLLLSIISFTHLFAQEPYSYYVSLEDKGNGEVELTAAFTIDTKWYQYDINIPDGGPMPTNLTIDEIKGAELVGTFKSVNSKLKKKYDDIFQMEVGYYEQQATFVQRIKITDKAVFSLEGVLRSQVCSEIDGQCIPVKIDLSFRSKDLPASLVTTTALNPDNAAKTDGTKIGENAIALIPIDTLALSASPGTSESSDLWTPVIDELRTYGAVGDLSQESLLGIFLWGFIGGLIALITPCVWPIIPMTVSFFLKRNKKSKAKAVKDAITYGIAIIIIYLTLGILITLLFGASALNELSTNMVFNLFLFALLIVFAASFFGAFEIVLPASWTNKIDSKADSTTGFVSIFFMAFTLALVSFSCTGPIIGTLLVETTSSGAILGPAVGMFGFALALAIPFTLFAIFPSWLNSMPKSGGWLNSVKVVLGFLELALAFKFLSVADMTNKWGILDREVFLVLWITIFALLGMYLLGKLRLPHDSEMKHVSVFRLFLAIVAFSFTVYMIPGLWGAPLRAISAFAPLPKTQDFNLYEGGVHAKFEDYEAGMSYAKRYNKPVIIDFSGYGCVNCRDMETSVWIDETVKNMLENDYVLITLMVDDKEKLPETIEVEENGKTSKLRTIGDKWSYLQRHKFGTNSQPYYVLLDNDGKPIGPSRAYDKDIKEYINFLRTGLENYKKQQEEKR